MLDLERKEGSNMNASVSERSPRSADDVPPSLSSLPLRTRAFAAAQYGQVAQAYLAFRQEHYHEEHPTLTSPPPVHAEVRHSELAVLAENTLRLVTPAVKSLPILGG